MELRWLIRRPLIQKRTQRCHNGFAGRDDFGERRDVQQRHKCPSIVVFGKQLRKIHAGEYRDA